MYMLYILKNIVWIINIYGLTCIYMIAVITSSLPITNFRNINYSPIDKSYI